MAEMKEVDGKTIIVEPEGEWELNPLDIPAEKPSVQEQLDKIKQDQLTLMDAIASMYEDMMAKGTV